MAKIQEIKRPTGSVYTITLPKLMVEKKNWKKGTELCFTWNERGNIEVHE